jgi:hypothetical protein
MNADRKILIIAGALGMGVGIATAISSDIGLLRGFAAMSMLYSVGVIYIGATGVREEAR